MRRLWIVIIVAAWIGGCQRGAPQLDGTWFVRYASDSSPYLDVAFRGKQPTSVAVVLRGPGGFAEDLPLTWNSKDREWQIVPDLPDPLPGGVWWVSEVRAQAGSSALKPCSRCKGVVYCGKACQAQHWKSGGHRVLCQQVRGHAGGSP